MPRLRRLGLGLVVPLAALTAAGCGTAGTTHRTARAKPQRAPHGFSTAVRATAAAASGVATPPQVIDGSFPSRAVAATLHYAIALPPGYAWGNERYPVIYVLHGLPAGNTAYRGIGGYAAELARLGFRAIVVGAQGSRSGDSDPEWHDWGPGRNWETATASELVSWIDGHLRTIPQRSARAIIGISAGGYGATLIAFHHPGVYSVIESWSGYFRITKPDGEPEDLGSVEANAYASAHATVRLLDRRFDPYGPTFFGFYTGDQDPYPGFVADNQQLDHELDAVGIAHVFRLYHGAHDGAFWRSHEDEWLAAAAERLTRPS